MTLEHDNQIGSAVSREEIALYLGVDVRTITNWERQGFPKLTRGKYPIRECVTWFANHETQKALRVNRPSIVTMDEAKLRQALADAQLKELELETARGEMIQIDDARKELEKYLSIVRQALLSFPARFAPYMVGILTEQDARLVIESHVAQMMNDLVKQSEQLDTIEEEPESPDDEEEEKERDD